MVAGVARSSLPPSHLLWALRAWSAPPPHASVCGIPPQAGDEWMSGVGGGVLSSGASAIGEITILRFLPLLVCTPECGAAASGREVDVLVLL